jgi:hypothetical protein
MAVASGNDHSLDLARALENGEAVGHAYLRAARTFEITPLDWQQLDDC